MRIRPEGGETRARDLEIADGLVPDNLAAREPNLGAAAFQWRDLSGIYALADRAEELPFKPERALGEFDPTLGGQDFCKSFRRGDEDVQPLGLVVPGRETFVETAEPHAFCSFATELDHLRQGHGRLRVVEAAMRVGAAEVFG